MIDSQRDPRLHIVAITGIIVKDGKFLITKRSMREVAFPGKWTVPGGKLLVTDYENLPKTTESYEGWYQIVEKVLRREIMEEVDLEIENVRYVTDYAFIRPDKIPVLGLSYMCDWKSREVVLGKDMDDYAWVDLGEAKGYDLIEGIYDELVMAAKNL